MAAYDIANALYVSLKAGEGATVDRDGIFDPRDHGYYVGGLFPSLVFDSVDTVDRGEVAWWIGTHVAKFYGVWADEETGKVYIDAVDWTYDLVAALTVGRNRGEIAVWDIAQGAEIRITNPLVKGD